jgi:uncharacterized protein (DUF305 family)
MIVFSRTRAAMAMVPILAVLSTSAAAHDPAVHQHQAAAPAEEAPFLAENDAAMTRMMNDMAVRPTGDANRDFVEMMIPHHQGAIDMAQTYLRYGSNEQLKRIAQEIIVDQQQEIAAMRLALGDPLPASVPAPTQAAPQASAPSDTGMPGMDPNMKMGN